MRAAVVVEEIEPAHLVGAVVRAIAGADAAIVGHHVETFLAVRGGAHRADRLAGGVLALHAQHRLMHGHGIVRRRRGNSGRCESSASRGRAAPAPCRRWECCFPPGRPTTHAPQPVQELRSTAMPHLCRSWRGTLPGSPESGLGGVPLRPPAGTGVPSNLCESKIDIECVSRSPL